MVSSAAVVPMVRCLGVRLALCCAVALSQSTCVHPYSTLAVLHVLIVRMASLCHLFRRPIRPILRIQYLNLHD
jgi:hypothetical protein